MYTTDPFTLTIKENTAYGRGTIDNKNNIASFMTILPALTKLDLGDMAVCFDFSGDEEIGGVHGSGNYQKKFGRMPDAVINGDSAGMVIVARRRNAMGATIHLPKKKASIRGTKLTQTFQTQQYGRHTAYQHRGADIHCLLKSSVEVAFNDWKVITVAADFIKGNVVPDNCTLTVIVPSEEGEIFTYDQNLTLFFETLRFLVNVQFPTEFSTYGITIGPNMLFEREDSWEIKLDIRAMTQDYAAVETALNKMCQELYGPNNYQLDFKPGQGRVNTSRETMLIRTALEVSKKFDFPGEIVEMGGASDARYFSREGIPTFDFGPKGGNVHASNEWLDLPSFAKVTEFYYEMVKTIAEKVDKK
jgi:succinyl-diaminopimelate desuccinylase